MPLTKKKYKLFKKRSCPYCSSNEKIILKTICYKNNHISVSRCKKCNLYCIETPEHVLFDGKETAFMRNKKWNDIVEHNSIPYIIDYLNQVDSKAKLMFMLNCFNSEYIK